jgi:glutaredoxin
MKHKLKQSKLVLFLFFACIITVSLIVFYLTSKTKEKPQLNLPVVYLQSDQEISNCSARRVDHKILLITSKYCPHCKEAIKTLTLLITAANLSNNFQILDVVNKEDAKILDGLGINVSRVPVLIVNCQAYIGAKDVSQYRKLLSA